MSQDPQQTQTGNQADPDLHKAVLMHGKGRLKEAERLYRAVLARRPADAQANHNLGLLAAQARAFERALPFFKTALESEPGKARHWFSYIDALLQCGRTRAAREVFRQAQGYGLKGAAADRLAQRLEDAKPDGGNRGRRPVPADAQALLQLFHQGRLTEAEALARRLTAAAPKDGLAWKILGAVLQAQGRNDEALAAMRQAVDLLPDHPDAHSNLGIALKQAGRLDEAEAAYRRALELDPDFAAAHGALGVLCDEAGRLDEAAAAYGRVVAQVPTDGSTLNNLGSVLTRLGRFDAAEEAYRKALAIKPDDAGPLNNLANLLRSRDRLKEAEAAYREALAASPKIADIHNNLGSTLIKLGRLEEAEASCREALRLDPRLPEAHNNLGNVHRNTGNLKAATACYDRALELRPDYTVAMSNRLYAMSYLADIAPDDYLARAREYGRAASRRAPAPHTEWLCSTGSERLKIGLVSGDLHNHPVSYFLESLLAAIDPAALELVAFPTSAREDALTARIRPRFSRWVPLTGLTDREAARRIHAEGVHVLFDLSGHTALNRLGVFAWQPAPVQVSWIGYMASTGLEQIDYVLADSVRVPPQHRAHFSEAVHELPATRLCFTPPDLDLEVDLLPASANGHITFACYQSLTKIGAPVLAAWAEILAAVPGSRLRLQCAQLADAGVRKRLTKAFKELGVKPSRLALHGPMAREAYLASYAEVDVNLDTFPFPGATTTCEALWMGVPTLTIAGDRMAARNGASVLTAAGLADWVAADRDDYVDKAVTLANNQLLLATLRAGLREQVLASPLCDAARFAGHFTDAVRAMWQERGIPRLEGAS